MDGHAGFVQQRLAIRCPRVRKAPWVRLVRQQRLGFAASVRRRPVQPPWPPANRRPRACRPASRRDSRRRPSAVRRVKAPRASSSIQISLPMPTPTRYRRTLPVRRQAHSAVTPRRRRGGLRRPLAVQPCECPEVCRRRVRPIHQEAGIGERIIGKASPGDVDTLRRSRASPDPSPPAASNRTGPRTSFRRARTPGGRRERSARAFLRSPGHEFRPISNRARRFVRC